MEDTAQVIKHPKPAGPIYAETDLNRFPVEPLSTFTNLIFLLVVIYWSIKTKLDVKKYPLITVSLPILTVGFIGGTIYHATRSSWFWLFLDYMPIMILILSGAIYFWKRILKKWYLTFILTLGPIFIYRFIVMNMKFNEKIHITLGYCLLALTVAVPAILQCYLQNRKNWKWLALAAVSFLFAAVFRQLDREVGKYVMVVGSHFLWHIFGGISTFFLIQYLYTTEPDNKI